MMEFEQTVRTPALDLSDRERRESHPLEPGFVHLVRTFSIGRVSLEHIRGHERLANRSDMSISHREDGRECTLGAGGSTFTSIAICT